MNRLEKLQAKVRTKLDRLEEIRNLEVEDVTDEIRTEMDELLADLEALKADIDKEKRAMTLSDTFSEPETPVIAPQIDNETEQRSGVEVGEDRATKKPWDDFGEFLRAVANVPMGGTIDPRLAPEASEMRAASGMSEGVLSDGGFLVAPQFVDTLINDAIETGVLAKKCRRLPMSRNTLSIPGVDETSRADGSRAGGIRAYWEGEADALTSSKPKFRRIEMKAKKLTGLCYATDELLEDSAALGAFIAQGFADEFGFKIDDAIFRGDGAGKPLGILNAGCKVEVSKESGQAAATILAENVMKMFARQMPRGVKNAVWYINQAAWPQIFQLHLAVGTAGVPLFIEPGKLANAPYGAILGRPIEPLEQCSALGTAGDIVFADLSQYLLCQKGGIQTASSMHVLFTTSEMAYRFVLRMDGEPVRAKALTPYKGSDTISSFVTLATRS